MTNEEKREFELHKKQAEKQLSDMYYGGSNTNGSKEALRMPNFFSRPHDKAQPDNANSQKQSSDSKQQKLTAPVPSFRPSGRGNLLELINFKNIKMDNDRLIILSLCLLLSAEQADELLLLALIYIML